MLVIAAAVANTGWHLPYDMTITSGTDGKHMEGSKHYTGDALDIRSSVFPDYDARSLFLIELRNRLGKDYDIVIEKDHIHIEYDPKPRTKGTDATR